MFDKTTLENMTIDANGEIERFASFDHPTRRFIAHSLSFLPPWPGAIGDLHEPINPPLPYKQSDAEAAERALAYTDAGELRAANHYGEFGQKLRRQAFGILLTMAKCDLKWKRLTRKDHLIFCYERLAGHLWLELLPLVWNEAALQRRKKGLTQLPLDQRILDNASVPNMLEKDAAPKFYPTLADADAFDSVD
jgi:hypothetical protein